MTNDAISLLIEDHRNFKALFRRFDQVKDDMETDAAPLVAETCRDITIHSMIEEELFYPLATASIDKEDLILEANQEHHVADVLIDELRDMAEDGDEFRAKFTVLKELVLHHLEEEEDELFPKVRDAVDANDLSHVGDQMIARRQELEAEARASLSSTSK